MSAKRPDIRLSKRDFARLDHLLATCSSGPLTHAADSLLNELIRAKIETAVPPGTVAMHAHVQFRDDDSGRIREVKLVYPNERHSGEDTLSVLTPLGAALIGLSAGQSIAFDGVDGVTRRITILKASEPDVPHRG